MEDELNNTESVSNESLKPKKKKKLLIPWKALAIYILPAFIVFIGFFALHSTLVQPPLSREEIMSIIDNQNKEGAPDNASDKDIVDPIDTKVEKLPQGSDIPLLGPQHYYHSFTGALATDLKNGSGILTIELAVSIFMGKLNADAYFENFRTFEPALRSAILALMRTKTKTELDTSRGKEALKLEILETINNALVELGVDPEIKTVQLTKVLLI